MSLNFFNFILICLFSFSFSSLLFELNELNPVCFTDELFDNGVLMIKYKIFTPSRLDLSRIYPTTYIYVINEETKKEEFRNALVSVKNKFTFTAIKAGLYTVCAYRTKNSNAIVNEQIYMNLKFASDNMDEISLNKALKKEDLNTIEGKSRQINDIVKKMMKNQERQTKLERRAAKSMYKSTKFYEKVSVVQIILIILIGVVNLFNFRRFLKSKNII